MLAGMLLMGSVGMGAHAQDADPSAADQAMTDEELSGVVEIGSIIPLTGKLARSGEENKIGYELAVDHFNEYLAAKGADWSLSVVSEDSQTQPTVTLEKVQALYAKGIQHVIGPQSSGNIQNIKGYVDANNILIVSPSSTSPLLAIPGDSIFRLAPDDSNQAVALVRVLEDAGIDVIVPIWRDEAWGVGLERAIRDSFSAAGGTVHDGIAYSPEANDFSSEASLLAEIVQGYVDEHGADKVGVASFGFGETQILFQSAANHDILDDVRWFGADAVTKDTVIVDDPIALEFATNVEFTTLQVASGKNDISKQVEEAVEEAIGRTPRTYASSAYDAIWLLGLSMEQTQSTDVDKLTAVFPEIAAEHQGALGSTRLNDNGDLAQTNYDVWNVSNDQWTFVGVYFAATDSIMLDVAMTDEELSGVVEIGSIIPLTGKLARSGEENKIGYELAVDHFNEYLAAKGADWSLSVVSEDSQTQPTVTLEKVQALYAKGIQHVIGPQSSGNIQNIKGYVDANNILIVSPSSTSPLLAIPGDSIFRLAPDDSNQAVALVRVLEDAGIDVIVPIWRDEAWGVGLERAIRDSFSAAGGTVHDGIAYSPEANDFSSEASLLAEIVQGYVDEHGADKVGVASFGFGETQILFQSAANHDILDDVRWFGADAVTKDTVIVDDPIALEFATNVEFTTLQVASGKNDISKQVEEAVEEAIGRTPRTYASSAYDAIWLLGLSMEQTQSTDVDKLTAVFPEIAAEHQGALGSTRLNDNGDLAQTNYDVWNVSNDQWTFVGVYFAATDSIMLDAMAAATADDDAMMMTETDDSEAAVDDDDAMMMTDDSEAAADDGGGGCLIATAAYGSELAPQVQFLREIRDGTLLTTESGTSFMTGFSQVYYSFSPAIADLERENPIFRDMVRMAITPAMYTMNIMTLADPGSEASVLAFGMLSIAAIGGIYVAGPYLTVRAVRQKVRQNSSN